MTLESTACRKTYIGNGAAKEFSFDFRVWEADEVAVFLEDVQAGTGDVDVTGRVAVKLSSTGGTVTFSQPPASGRRIVIRRRMPFTQEDDYLDGTRFDPHEVEDRFDMDCAERQELRCGLARAVTVPETGGTPESFWQDLRDWHSGIMANISKAGGLANTTPITAGGTVSARALEDRFADFVNVLDYGAKGGGSANDRPAFEAAASAAAHPRKSDGAGERLIYVPAGSYRVGEDASGLDAPAVLPGQYFTDGMVEVLGGARMSIMDAGTMHAGALVDTLRFGVLGFVPKREFFDNTASTKKDISYGIQGVASDGEYLYLLGHADAKDTSDRTVDNAYQLIVKFDIARRAIVRMFTFANFGHANSACWRDGKLYLPTGGGKTSTAQKRYQEIAVVNASNLSFPPADERYLYVTGSVSVAFEGKNYPWEAHVSSLAWDETRQCWWGITTDKFHSFLAPDGADPEPIVLSKLVDGTGDDAGKLVCVGAWTVGKHAGERHNQGIGCDRGLVYIPIYRADFEDEGWARYTKDTVDSSGTTHYSGDRIMTSSASGWHPSGAVSVSSAGAIHYWAPTEKKTRTLRSRGHVIAVWDPAVERVIHQHDLPYGLAEAEDVAFAGDALILTCAGVNMYSNYFYAARHRKDVRPTLGPLVGEDNWEPGLKVMSDEQKLRIYVDCAKPPLPVAIPGQGQSCVQCEIRDIYRYRGSGALLYENASTKIPDESVASATSSSVDAVAQGQGTPGDPFSDFDFALRAATMRDYHSVVIHIAGDATFASIAGTRSREERHNIRDFDTLILAGWTEEAVASAYADTPLYSGTSRRGAAPNSVNPVVGCLRFEGIRHVGLQDLLCRPTNTSAPVEEIIHFSNCGARIDGVKFHYSKLGHAPETLIRAESGTLTVADVNFNGLVRTSSAWSSGGASGVSHWYASTVTPASGSAASVTVVSGGALVRCVKGGVLNLPGTNSAASSAEWAYRGVSSGIAFYGAGLVVGADSSITDLVTGGGVYYGSMQA